MKIIKSELLKKNKYLITMEITDKDIELFEDLAYVYVTKGTTDECEFRPEYQKQCKHWFHQLWKHCWRKFPQWLSC